MTQPKEYYLIDEEVITASGITLPSCILVLIIDVNGVTTNGMVNADYKGYVSKACYDAGDDPFKLKKDGVRVKNVSTFDFTTAGVSYLGTDNYQTVAMKMIETKMGASTDKISAILF